MNYKLIHGDCLDVMRGMADNSIDSIVTDPPSGIAFMGKKWDTDKGGRDEWIAWMQAVAAECLRVIKPGGHALVWAIPRTSHWTGMAWENAGWEARDKVYHVFGSGFPKSYNIGKGIDKYIKTGNASWNGTGDATNGALGYSKLQNEHGYRPNNYAGRHNNKTDISTPEAQQWDGWGSALKPAAEEWWLFRAPLAENTIAANVLAWGTGAINVDGCRVGTSKDVPASVSKKAPSNCYGKFAESGETQGVGGHDPNLGRFPATFTHDGSDDVLALFPVSSNGHFPNGGKRTGTKTTGDTGSAARFFYVAKASKRDRDEGLEGLEPSSPPTMNGYVLPSEGRTADKNGGPKRNHHPTVKATALMRWLVRLITPPGGVVLDPFMGSGSTGKAALLEGFGFVGIEQDAEYLEIARARIDWAVKNRQTTEQLALFND